MTSSMFCRMPFVRHQQTRRQPFKAGSGCREEATGDDVETFERLVGLVSCG